jgi:hypothetical protein
MAIFAAAHDIKAEGALAFARVSSPPWKKTPNWLKASLCSYTQSASPPISKTIDAIAAWERI